MKNKIIAVDFDGTCVTHDYPRIGKDIGSIPVLKRLVENGHNLILWTMRSGKELNDAIKWFDDNGIELYGIQENPTQKSWTNSPKAYAELYIDDAALGCPLKMDRSLSNRPFVDWEEVGNLLFS
jgi:hydroxymethylpyrimidine pyrophosphatase-like HAD family hydrolase